jgi:hypothetical protein
LFARVAAKTDLAASVIKSRVAVYNAICVVLYGIRMAYYVSMLSVLNRGVRPWMGMSIAAHLIGCGTPKARISSILLS